MIYYYSFDLCNVNVNWTAISNSLDVGSNRGHVWKTRKSGLLNHASEMSKHLVKFYIQLSINTVHFSYKYSELVVYNYVSSLL